MKHHLDIPDSFGEWVLSHRGYVLAVYALITIVAFLSMRQAPLRVSILQAVMADESRYQEYMERAALFGGDSDDVLYVATCEGDALFTPGVLNSLRSATRAITELPDVERVISIVDAPRLSAKALSSPVAIAARTVIRRRLAQGEVPAIDAQALRVRKYWPSSPASQRRVDLATMKQEMRDDPFAGRLISADGSGQLMLIRLADSSSLASKPQTQIGGRIEQILRDHQLGRQGVYAAGTLIVQDWMFHEVFRTLTVILPVVTLVVCILVHGIFRRLGYVLMTLFIAAVAIIWSLGLTAFVYGEISLLVIAVPALILVISTADTIHLGCAYIQELRAGLDPQQAVRKVFRQVGGACVLTSITTFIGFLSLMLVPAASVRHMALACAVGVASALLLALTIVPMVVVLLKPPPVVQEGRSLLNRLLTGATGVCQKYSLTYPRTVVGVHLVLLLVAAALAMRLDHDADLPARFPRSHPLRQSIDYFNKQMFGTSTVEIIIRTDPEDLLKPETLSGLAEFDRQLNELPEVRDVISVVTLFQVIDRLIGLETASGLPESAAAAHACLDLVEQTNAGDVDNLIARDAGLTRVVVQVVPTGVVRVLDFGQQLTEVAQGCLPSHAHVELSGYYPIVGNAVREVVRGQVYGFATCFACVMVVVTIGLRSIRLSLLSVLPNLLPLVLLGGALALRFDVVDSDVLGIAIVSFGLAVDDTIHFLHRYDVELSQSASSTEALKKTFEYTGGAILRTTVILGVGLLPFALSGYASIRLLGTYLVFVLSCAVLADLLLLPALVKLFGKKAARHGGSKTDFSGSHGADYHCADDRI